MAVKAAAVEADKMAGLMDMNDMQQEPSAFKPILNDSDFMYRMDSGEFDMDKMDDEAKKAVFDYINKEEKRPGALEQQILGSGMQAANQLGMSANKDMSGYAQAMPMQGLMGIASYNNQQKAPFKGLMGY